MRLVKSYLRATTGQGRLNHLMILSAYKENADEFNFKDVARKFIHKTTQEYHYLGRFVLVNTDNSMENVRFLTSWSTHVGVRFRR